MLSIPDELSGLSAINVEDHKVFSDAVENNPITSHLHYFPFLNLFGNHVKKQALLFEQVEGSVLIYLLRQGQRRLRLSLYLPPFPFSLAALRHAQERMQDFNGSRSGRIVWVQESDVIPVARAGFEIFFKEEEFIFDRAAVMALEGPGFRSLRQELSRARKPGQVETRHYTSKDRKACIALVEDWWDRLVATGMKANGYSYTIACLEMADRFPQSLLNGLVVEVNGEVRGFAFSGSVTGTMGCNFLCITDNDFRGLPHLLRYRLMDEFPGLIRFNDSTDAGRPGLRELKQRFRPIAMHGLFGAREA
ncbi:phosphatidylglycerol lysyltransferase domain-containing protein [Microvirga sp. 2YAF29]|uniref:phosphatidylglycerol lysyltransferase domain-containing protein n=1 Tax=Microvirga sp. 2YAF29 TaxID=3233031 RepID=UPI003F973389